MKGSVKVAKGRIEEAVGALSNNDNLRSKGKLDQAVGQVIQTGERNIRKAKNSAHASISRAKDNAQRAEDRAKGAIL